MDSDEEVCAEIAVVIEAVTEIINILNEAGDTVQALEILAASTSFVLCNWTASAKDFDRAKKFFIYTVDQATNKAEDLGATMWTRGTSH
jgi:hypothetical protein